MRELSRKMSIFYVFIGIWVTLVCESVKFS